MQDDHFVRIYAARATDYERMIDAEDADGNLLPLLKRLVDFSGKRVVDLGSGTGRLPRLLHKQAGAGLALDVHTAMLQENRRLQRHNGFHWPVLQGDLRQLPLADDCADVAIAGWAIGHFCGWYRPAWQKHVVQALREMRRVVRSGGDLLILETLGTGVLSPAPPADDLAHYYELLEHRWGFRRHVVVTDYEFASVSDAVRAMAFFFGESLAREIQRQGWQRVPEWTGLWHLRH